MSNHDFHKTPEAEESLPVCAKCSPSTPIFLRLRDAAKYQRCADVACRDPGDAGQYADRPIITMSMAKTGVISLWLVKYLGRRQLLVR